MKKRIARLLIALSLVLSLPLGAHADTIMRGMTLSPDVTEDDIRDLAEYGANLVRYQLAWNGPVDTASVAEYNAWLETALTKLGGLLPVFAETGIGVVVDLHTPPGGLSIRATPHQYRLFSEQEFQDAFIAVWDTITARYLGNTTIWGYDILNEPAVRFVEAGLKDWNALALHVGQRIRTTDALHKIIVEPIYGDQSKLTKLTPLALDGVIYSPHNYYPKKFREQGFNGKKINVVYPKGDFNKAGIQKALRNAIAFQKKYKVEMYLGEFAAPRWAPGKSAFLYLKDSISIFEKQKWHWTYHAWREDDAWSVEHGSKQSDHTISPTLTDRAKLMMKAFSKNSH